MADAESNLVPSEAADQVEVALEKQAAADDGILYLNEYQYENDLVTDFARLVASPRRRGSLYVAAAIAALIGIGMLVAGGNWIKFGVVLIVFGAFLAWWSKNLHHTLARDFIDAVEADESMGGRYRRVAANEDGLMVWGKSGKSQFFPFEKLDHVLDGERIFVAMFADQGVTIPKDTFVRGDAEQFGSFLKARINKKLRIETKKKKMKAEKAAAEAKQGDKADKPQDNKGKQRKQKKSDCIFQIFSLNSGGCFSDFHMINSYIPSKRLPFLLIFGEKLPGIFLKQMGKVRWIADTDLFTNASDTFIPVLQKLLGLFHPAL